MKTLFSIFRNTDNSFDGKEADEKVLLLTRRHPFFIIIRLIFILILAILPIMLSPLFSAFLSKYGLFGLGLLAYSLWCLVLWQILFHSITMYVLDVWIVTDRRIIDSTQHGFFNRSVSELHLTRVQDISVKVDGLFQSILKFGDLVIQTAGTENKFDFRQIPNPNAVKDQIMSHISESVVPITASIMNADSVVAN